MNLIKKIIFSTLLLLLPSLLISKVPQVSTTENANSLAVFFTIEGNAEKEYNALVEKKLKTIGFNLTDPHKRVNDHYKTEFGSTVLDILSFMPVVNDKMVLPLLNIDPRIAGFAPFNMLIEKKLDEKNTHVGHLMPKVMLDILGIENKEVRETFTASFKALDEMIAKELGGEKHYIELNKLPEQPMMNFEYSFDIPEDIEDFMDEFQDQFETALTDKKYLVAGYHNFMESTDDAQKILKDYDAFWTYSLCHMEFSYNVFDKKGARPDAGLFAPCTMYMYIPKGSGKLYIGMYRLHNWSDSLGIDDPTRVALVEKLDKELPQILIALGAKPMENVNTLTLPKTAAKVPAEKPVQKPEAAENTAATKESAPKKEAATPVKDEEKKQTIDNDGETIEIIIPLPPKVPTPLKVKTTNSNDTDTRSIKFSKRVPPNYVPSEQRTVTAEPKNTSTNIGEVANGKISTYLRGKFMDVKTAQATLKEAGFDILSTSPVDKKGKLISIVFTDKTLTEMGSKKNTGFIGSLRLLVNKKDNHISITNPLYMAKAFMQDQYDEKSAKATLGKITAKFHGMLNSKDQLKFQLLPKYQFMHGMPQYKDMVTVARGDDLLAKLQNNKNIVFTQKLNNGAVLAGVKLGKRTSKFTSKIGTNNAALLPYPVIIENKEAKILEPKYYISVMYPLLQMSEFMTIATVPGAIIKDCEKVFR